jgi:hypothetical protein
MRSAETRSVRLRHFKDVLDGFVQGGKVDIPDVQVGILNYLHYVVILDKYR